MTTERNGLLARVLGRRVARSARGEQPSGTPTLDGPAPVTDLDEASFMAGTAGGWTIVDFWAPWCRPCRSFHPVFESTAREHATDGLRFARVDVDANPTIAQMVGIRGVPTVVLFDPDGNEHRRVVGVPPAKAMRGLIEQAT